MIETLPAFWPALLAGAAVGGAVALVRRRFNPRGEPSTPEVLVFLYVVAIVLAIAFAASGILSG